MADRIALVVSSGVNSQLPSTDTLRVGAGIESTSGTLTIDAGSAGSVQLGTVTATSIAIGQAGVTTTITGPLANSVLTPGSVLFAGTAGLVSQDNSVIFYDAANDRLGLGTNVPEFQFDSIKMATTSLATETMGRFSQTVNPVASASASTYLSLDVVTNVDAANTQNISVVRAQRVLASTAGSGANVNVSSTLEGAAYQAINGVVFGAAAGTSYAANIRGITLQAINNSLHTASVISGVEAASFACDTRGPASITNLRGFNMVLGSTYTAAPPAITNFIGIKVGTSGIFGEQLTAATIGNPHMINVGSFPVASATLVYTNPPTQIHLVSPTASTHVAIRQLGSSTLGQNRFQSFCKFGADSAPAVQMDIVGGITQITGAVSMTANGSSLFKTTAGSLNFDAFTSMDIGSVTCTGMAIGSSSTIGSIIFTFAGMSGIFYTSNMPNGASAIGHWFNTTASYTTAGAKLVAWNNSGTEKASIDKDGDGAFRRRLATGTVPVAGDFVLSATWGLGAAVSLISGNDSALQFTITAGTTGRTALATCTYTFKNGAFAVAPKAIVLQSGASVAAEAPDGITWTTTTTTLVITYVPVPGSVGVHTFTVFVTGTV